ncbi:hypothetical protein QT608_22625, partial [Xanthomonas citri pv. citri]
MSAVLLGFVATAPRFSAASEDDRRTCADRQPTARDTVAACTSVLSDKSDLSEHASAYHHRGVGYLRLREFDRAIADFDAVTRLDPNYSFAYAGRA